MRDASPLNRELELSELLVLGIGNAACQPMRHFSTSLVLLSLSLS